MLMKMAPIQIVLIVIASKILLIRFECYYLMTFSSSCRPMWCVSCLAKWFASRQNQYEKETWLRNKATCPMCRAKFCVLDVSFIRRIEVQ